LTSKLHAVCNGEGRPIILLLAKARCVTIQTSDYMGAALMVDALPRAKVLPGDKGYIQAPTFCQLSGGIPYL
jgi:putative transposase